MYKKWIQSYRDLPLLINQWANVVRWEMRTRLFLRTTEFLWQEGHTAHATEEEAEKETLLILGLYKKLAEEYLAIPVLTGLKSDAEKFAGAERTYCIEAMMGDKRALQAGTSHNLGQNFAKAFGVTYQTEDNQEELVYATSWGVSTRLIGAVIMTHGDDKGLRLPPRVAPYQVVIVPIYRTDEDKQNISQFIEPLLNEFSEKKIRTHQDWSTNSPGFKFNEWEMKGVPLRMEVGPRDVEENQVMLVRRDTGDKIAIPKDNVATKTENLLEDIQDNLFQQALSFREKNTYALNSFSEFKSIIENNGGFVRCGWDGDAETELKIKEETKATIRCILSDGDISGKTCIYSGNPAKYEVIFAKAY
jgi:prolyl-tRNA synthetase